MAVAIGLPLILLYLCMVEIGTALQPPHIEVQSKTSVIYIYKSIEDRQVVTLPCEASGNPTPSYKWTVNGKDLEETDHIRHVVHNLPKEGKIDIHIFFNAELDGIYQCFATNEHGTSVSNKVLLVYALLEMGPDLVPTQVHMYTGIPQKLLCPLKHWISKGDIHWIQRTENGTETDIVDLFPPEDFAIAIDDGSLHFRAMKLEHDSTDKPYVCVVTNEVPGSRAFGKKYTLKPNVNPNGGTKPYPVRLLHASPSDVLALKGDTIKLQCIFGANPYPHVHWERPEKGLPSKAILSQDNSTLTIPNIHIDDIIEGYVCIGKDDVSTPVVQRQFTLKYFERPTWTIPLASKREMTGDTAQFFCSANGLPAPWYIWYINGVEFSAVRDQRIYQNPRVTMTVSRTNNAKLTISNITEEDSMVIQCNATNKYGNIWADAYLAVGEEEVSHGESVQLALNALLLNLVVAALISKMCNFIY